MASPIPRTPPRQARSRTTHRHLLEATVACLVERGYAGTTTPEICARAGVSQGALFKHFGSKSELLAATVEHLFAFLVEDFRRSFAALAGCPDPLQSAVELLRDTFARPTLHAALELMVASRTDLHLAQALAPVQQAHRENLSEAAAQLFPQASEHPAFDATLDLLMTSLQGAAVSDLALPDPPAEARRLALLVELARRVVGGEC